MLFLRSLRHVHGNNKTPRSINFWAPLFFTSESVDWLYTKHCKTPQIYLAFNDHVLVFESNQRRLIKSSKSMSSSRPSRRSARKRDNDVVAPGGGTTNDINRLTRDLGGALPSNAVLAMMKSEGSGVTSEDSAAVPFASPKTSSAWSDFMAENADTGPTATATATATATKSSEHPPNKKLKMEDGLDKKESSSSSSDGQAADYELKTEDTEASPFGSLVQCGTMDSTLVGRKNLKATDRAVYHLSVPTVLMPLVAITKVCTSCNSGT